MSEPRSIATVTDYAGLVAALRSWVAQLGTTFECLDHVARLPTRYCAKLLGPSLARGLSITSMGALLASLGLRLNVVVDEEALQKIRHRLTPSRWTPNRHATERRKLMEAAAASAQGAHACLETGKHRCAGDSEWGRRAQAAKMLKTSPEARRRQASRAANARWKAARRRVEATNNDDVSRQRERRAASAPVLGSGRS